MRFCTFFYFFSFLLCILQTKGPPLCFVKMRPISAGMPGHLSLTIFFSFPYPIFLAFFFFSFNNGVVDSNANGVRRRKLLTRCCLFLVRSLDRSSWIFFIFIFCRWYFQFFSFFLVVGCFRSKLRLLRRLILMSLENSDGLLNLALQGLVMLQHVQQLGVVDLEKHARNFSG